jgi:autotransporter-associated beta strand protein
MPDGLTDIAISVAASAHSLTRRRTFLAVTMLAGVSWSLTSAAVAQNATWLANPTVAGPTSGTFDFDANPNWSSGTVPTGTASFGASAGNNLSFSSDTIVGGFTFNSGASNYTFSNDKTLQFTGAGLIINGGSASFLNSGIIEFFNSSTAGSAAFTNAQTGSLNFHDTSTAGSSTIVSSGLVLSGGLLTGGAVNFFDGSSAGTATITINPGGAVGFSGTSTAGTAKINNAYDVFFGGAASADHATINNAGTTITINGNPVSTNGATAFFNSSSAGNATITNDMLGHVLFTDTSSAANATIINNNGGQTVFWLNGSGGQARFVTNAGGVFDISGLSSGGTTAGSIEGAGSYSLGSKSLTVGGLNSDTEVSGVISGAGGTLIKVGTGKLTLSGANAYTGGTTISAGTLQLGSGGTSGSVLGSINNNGVLAINRSDVFTLSNPIAGVGELRQNGSGLTILTGPNTYAGATTVNAGILDVESSVLSSSGVTVNAGAALAGTGIVSNTIINSGGTLAPGSGTPGTALTIVGNLAFQSGALYLVQVSPSASSTTNVSGTATLAGTAQANFTQGTYVERNYTILTAAGGRTGTFDVLTTSGLPAGFQTSLTYTGNTAVLKLTAQLVPTPTPDPTPTAAPTPTPTPTPTSAAPSFTANQLNVGNAIDNFFNNGGALPPSFVRLFGLTGSNLTNALSRLSGEAATGGQQTVFQFMGQFLNLMLNPFFEGRSDNRDGPAVGFAPERQAMPEDIALAYAKATKSPALQESSTFGPRWSVWAGGFGGYNQTSGDPAIGSHDLTARAAGGSAVLDYHLTRDAVIGFALAGGGTNWALAEDLGGGKSDVFQGGVYAAARSGPVYIAASLAAANHWVSTDRFAAFGDHLTASFDAQSIGGRGRL